MKAIPVALAIALAVPLSGCASMSSFLTAPAGKDSTMGQAILQHLELCSRNYKGAIGAGVTGSFEIDCPAASPEQLAAMRRAGIDVGTVVAPIP